MAAISAINSESMDPNALRQVIGGGGKTSSEKIDQAGVQFEAIFVRQFLNDALKPMIKNITEGEDDAASSTYRYMITDKLSQSLASQGVFGLGHQISTQLKGRQAMDANSGNSGGASADSLVGLKKGSGMDTRNISGA